MARNYSVILALVASVLLSASCASAACTLKTENGKAPASDTSRFKMQAAECDANKGCTTVAECNSRADAMATQAAAFWNTETGGKNYQAGQIQTVKVLYSFGAKDVRAEDGPRNGFTRIMRLSDTMLGNEFSTGKSLGLAASSGNLGALYYVDAKALATLPGAYWKPGVPDGVKPGAFTLNLWWDSYYKEAMGVADFMVFLLTEGWFVSKWCGQELDWAIATRTGAKKNIVIALDAYSAAILKGGALGQGDLSESSKTKWDKLTMAGGKFVDLSTSVTLDGSGSSDQKIIAEINKLTGSHRFRISSERSGLQQQ